MRTSPNALSPIAEADFTQTGYSYTLSLIQGKHKMVILYCLMEYEPVRFNEMRRYLGRISDKTLSVNLKELERDGLIVRTEYPQIPRKWSTRSRIWAPPSWKCSTKCAPGAKPTARSRRHRAINISIDQPE